MKDFFKDISIRAVLTGLAVDIGGTFAFFFVFATLGSLVLASSGREIEELDVYAKTTSFLVISSFAGLLFSSLGGFVSARIARKAEIRNAFTMGILSVIIGVFFLVRNPEPEHWWFDVIALILILPFAVLGGYVCLKGNAEEEQRIRN